MLIETVDTDTKGGCVIMCYTYTTSSLVLPSQSQGSHHYNLWQRFTNPGPVTYICGGALAYGPYFLSRSLSTNREMQLYR